MQNAAAAIDGQDGQSFDAVRSSFTPTAPPAPTATAPMSPRS